MYGFQFPPDPMMDHFLSSVCVCVFFCLPNSRDLLCRLHRLQAEPRARCFGPAEPNDLCRGVCGWNVAGLSKQSMLSSNVLILHKNPLWCSQSGQLFFARFCRKDPWRPGKMRRGLKGWICISLLKTTSHWCFVLFEIILSLAHHFRPFPIYSQDQEITPLGLFE